MSEQVEAAWDRLRDDLPESFWRVATWLPDGNYITGSLDVADRKRISVALIATLPNPPAPEASAGVGEGVDRG